MTFPAGAHSGGFVLSFLLPIPILLFRLLERRRTSGRQHQQTDFEVLATLIPWLLFHTIGAARTLGTDSRQHMDQEGWGPSFLLLLLLPLQHSCCLENRQRWYRQPAAPVVKRLLSHCERGTYLRVQCDGAHCLLHCCPNVATVPQRFVVFRTCKDGKRGDRKSVV